MKAYPILLAALAAISPFALGSTVFTFGGLTPDTTSGDALPTTVTFQNAYYETLDEDGVTLTDPGFRADLTTPVVVGNPSASDGWGADIAGKALDATGGPVLLTFANPIHFTGFGVTLDNSTLGSPCRQVEILCKPPMCCFTMQPIRFWVSSP